MQVVCEATQCSDNNVQVAALQNMVKIMSLYYQYMEAYMGPALFAVSLSVERSPVEIPPVENSSVHGAPCVPGTCLNCVCSD